MTFFMTKIMTSEDLAIAEANHKRRTREPELVWEVYGKHGQFFDAYRRHLFGGRRDWYQIIKGQYDGLSMYKVRFLSCVKSVSWLFGENLPVKKLPDKKLGYFDSLDQAKKAAHEHWRENGYE